MNTAFAAHPSCSRRPRATRSSGTRWMPPCRRWQASSPTGSPCRSSKPIATDWEPRIMKAERSGWELIRREALRITRVVSIIPIICTRPGPRFFRAWAHPTRCSPASRYRGAPVTSSWPRRPSRQTRVSKACSTASRSATGRCRRSVTNLGETTPAPFGFDGVCWRDGSGRISAFSGLRDRRPPAMYCGCSG